jgi:hypothetical protein
MPETAQQYTARLLSYSAERDGLKLQEAAPRKLAALTRGTQGRRITKRPAPGKWSVAEILAHMADAEVAIGWRMRQILASPGIAVQAYDQDAWANTFQYAKRDPKQSLAAFTALREANIVLLKSVPRSAWTNYGMHAERGRESIAHMVQLTAGHDLNHIMQIERILKGKQESR